MQVIGTGCCSDAAHREVLSMHLYSDLGEAVHCMHFDEPVSTRPTAGHLASHELGRALDSIHSG